MIGKTLGRYEIQREIGSGGMARVFLARDVRLERPVALKLLHDHLSSRPENRVRIEREARGLARLHHENVIEVYDYSEPESPDCYIVTEFIEGQTLKNFVSEHAIPLPEIAVMIAAEVASALEAAHGEGIIHRDVKPENVMISADGTVKLMDFGIAQVRDTDGMTMTGHLIGSPAFMSPEQASGEKVDKRSDIFSLGLMLYWLAAGHMPFEITTTPAVIREICEADFESPQMLNPQISNRLARLILSMLDRDPEKRPADATELREQLLYILQDCGLAEYRNPLREFLANPGAGVDSIEQTIIESLLERAREDVAKKQYGAALDRLNRVLLIDPQSRDANDLIARLSSRSNRRKWARTALISLLAVALVFAGFELWPVISDYFKAPQKTEPAVVIPQPGVTVTETGKLFEAQQTKTGETTPQPQNERPARLTERIPATPPPTEPQQQPTDPQAMKFGTLTLHINPHGKVYLDGREYSRESKIDHQYRLTVGEHQLVIRNNYYKDYVETVTIPEEGAEVEMRVRLVQLPSYIKVTAPEGAVILIDGEEVGVGPVLVKQVSYDRHMVQFRIGDELRPPLYVDAVPGRITPAIFYVPEPEQQ